MYSTATTADYASGIDAEPPKPAEDTSFKLGEALKDFAIDAVARPGLTLARSAVEGYRLADPENKAMAELGDTLGSGEKALLAERSPRARLFDSTSLTPGVGEKSFFSAPVESSVRALLPSVPYLAAAPFTGGASAAVGLGVLQGTSAVLGENIAQLRDAATQTPVDKMMQSPRFVDLMRQYDGDEAKAREAIFRESLDPKSLAASFLVNAAQLPAVLRPLQKGVSGVGKRIAGAGIGAGEGAVLGGGEGLTDAYIEQVGKVRRGEQDEIKHEELASGAGRGAIFAGPTAASHALAPPTRAASGKITTPTPKPATTGPAPIGTETTTTLNEQMNDAGRTPPSPTMPAVEPEPTFPTVQPGTGDRTQPFTGEQELPPEPTFFPTVQPGTADRTQPVRPEAPLPAEAPGRPAAPVDRTQPFAGEAPLPAEAPGRPAGVDGRTEPFIPDALQDQAQPLSRETAAQPAGETVATFKTAKGSEYILFGNGTTVRNKAARPEHPGDSGVKERSQATVFVTPQHAMQLSLVQAEGGPGPMRLARLPDGRVGVQYTDGPQRGGFERRTVGQVFSQPRAGLMPLEIWNGGTTHHFGNEITEVTPSRPAAAREAQPAPEAPFRPAAAVEPRPPPVAARRAWLEREHAQETNPERRAWLERQLAREPATVRWKEPLREAPLAPEAPGRPAQQPRVGERPVAPEAPVSPEAPFRKAPTRLEGAPLQPYEGQQIDPNLQQVAEAETARRAAAEAERVKPASQAAAYAGLAERKPAKGPPQKKAPEAKAAPKPAVAPAKAAPAAAPKAEPAKAAKAKEVSQRRTAAKAAPPVPRRAAEPAKKAAPPPAPTPAPTPAKGARGPAHRTAVEEARALQAEGRALSLIPESKKTKAQKDRQQAIREEIQRRLAIPADVVIDIPPGGTSIERWNQVHQAALAEGYSHEGAVQSADRQINQEVPAGERRVLPTTESVAQVQRNMEQDIALERKAAADQDARWKQIQADFPIKWTTKPGQREMPLDGTGLPADRLPRVKGEPTAEQRQAQDAHEQLDNVGEPDHPLITPAETPQDTMARVKGILARGEAGDISSFVDAAFLDDLATVTTGAKIYHAPYDVTSNVGTRAGAFYDPGTDRVVLPTDVSPQNYVRAAVHESVHAATEGMLLTDPKFAAEVSAELERARAKAAAQGVDLNNLPRDLYGLTNPSEFLAESKSNPAFREFLGSVKAPTNPVIQGARTVLNALYRTIRDAWRRVIGAKNGDTALDVLFYDQSTVLGRTDAIVKRAINQLKKNGRPAVQGGTVRPERRYLNVTRGAQDVYDNLTQGVGHAAGEVKHFWNTFDHIKARGLDFYTPSDMTQIGSPEFRKLSAAAFKIEGLIEGRTEQMRDVNKRRIAKVAKIYNGWTKEARQEAREFVMDEGMHTAFADVPLNDPKNAHIDPASLANAQVVRQHDEMRARHDSAAARLPGFKQWRDGVYSYFADVEKDMRWSTVHSLVEHSELVPATVTGKVRTDAHIALARAASVDLTLRPQDVTALQRAGVDLQDPRIADVISAIRETAPLQKIEGPYTPWNRHGDQAIYGEFTTHDAPNGIRLGTSMNEVPGQALGSNKMAFPTEAEARAYEKQVSDDLGIAQLDGGEVFMRNGARVADANGRPLGNNEVEAILKRAQKAADALQNNKTITSGGRALTAAELQARVDAAKGIAKHYYVGFQPKILQMYATEAEAARAREDLLEQYKGHQVGGKAGLQITPPQDVVRHEGRQNEHFVGTQMQSLINRTRATTTYQNLHPTQQSELTRGMTEAVARYTMRRGINQRKLPRGYVRGASTDIMASMDEYNGMSSRYIAKVEHAAQVRDADQAMKDYLKDNRFTQGDNNAKANERVYNALHQRRNDPPMRDTTANRWIDRIIRWTMLDKLPDVGYLMVQAFDPANSTFPMLASRHGGIKSAATMAGFYRHADVFTRHARSAGRDIAQSFVGGADVTNWRDHMQKSVANHPMAAGLQDMYGQAADRAVYSIASSMDYTSSLANRAMIDRVSGRLSGILGGLTTGVENLSRFVGLGAAYELEMGKQLKDAGGNFATPEAAAAAHQAAVEYAIKTAHNANGVMAEFNKPRFFTKTPLHRLFTLFRSYSQRFAMRYIEGFGGAWRASRDTLQGKARSAEDVELAKRLGWMLVTQGLLAGALGLPTEPFTLPLNAAYLVGLSPYNSQDMEAGFRRFVDSKLGGYGGEIFSRGIFRAIGWDLHGRMSQATLLGPHGAPGSTKSKDLMAATLNYFGGAPVGTAFEAYKGLQAGVEGAAALADGRTSVGYKKLNEAAKNLIMFRQASDVWAAVNGMDPDAQRSQSGRARTAPYTTTEAIVKGITGYEPSRISEGRERTSTIDTEAKRIRNERKQYSDAFAQAKTESERNALRERIRKWNAGKPIEHQLTFADLRRAQVTRQKAEAQPADQGGITADRITRPLFGQYGFYNQ